MKLPQSRLMALGLPFASPTGYGLGKSGWVSVQFGPREKPPMDLMRAWIDESYRAVAPKKLVATLPAAEPADAGPRPKNAAAREDRRAASHGAEGARLRQRRPRARPARAAAR